MRTAGSLPDANGGLPNEDMDTSVLQYHGVVEGRFRRNQDGTPTTVFGAPIEQWRSPPADAGLVHHAGRDW